MGRVERLALRERSLAAAVRRVRIELGLPGTFDPDVEEARLVAEAEASRRLARRRFVFRSSKADPGPLSGPERRRVLPVPAPRPVPPDVIDGFDLHLELLSHAARFCGRRAAEDLLGQRSSPARGHIGSPAVTWPTTPLSRNADGELYAGSAGRVMGELVARRSGSAQAAAEARVAVRCYIAEFVDCVVSALLQERDIAIRLGMIHEQPLAEWADALGDVRSQLTEAACERIAAQARALRGSEDPSAEEVAALTEDAADDV